VEQQLELLWKSDVLLEPAPQTSISQETLNNPVREDMGDKNHSDLRLSDGVQGNFSKEDQTDSANTVAALLDKVAQLSQVEPGSPSEHPRIKQLEQALYQCQLYIDELKQQLVDQAFLEEQLAATESFSHIQKQAIETLKSQAAQQQPLQIELEGLKQQIQSMQTQSMEAEAIAKDKETEVSTLKLQILRTQSDLDRAQDKTAQFSAQLDALQSSMVQETQQRIISQKTAERLRTESRNRDAGMRALEEKLERAELMLQQREEMIMALKSTNKPYSEKDQCIQGLSATLLKAQRQITELENELSNQSILQAQLQHTTHELESDAKTTQSRSDQLEKQVNDLQEQVLRQAQQASEYETAIQHWKTRSVESEEWAAQVAQLWDGLSLQQQYDVSTSPDLIEALTSLSRWFKGSRGNLTQDDVPPLSPKELLGLRPRWQSNF
jgi:myosin heavy subunit